jgi:hypothetical protein
MTMSISKFIKTWPSTKDLKVRKTNLWTQRYESLTPNMKDLHPKTKTLKDVCYKDIALKDIVL